jgi:hypothetical protein
MSEEEEGLSQPQDKPGPDIEQDTYIPVQVSSDSAADHSETGVHVDESDQSLGDRFEKFMKAKHHVHIEIDIGRIDLLPPQLRQPITNLVTKITRWAARNPSGPALTALQDLADRLNDFLELQLHREDHDYELRCRDLLKHIYQNTLETQRVNRELKDAAIPRSLDEYE